MEPSQNHSVHLVKSLLGYCGIDTDGIEEENKILLSIDYETTVFIVVENGLIHFIGALGDALSSRVFYLNLLKENFKSCTGADYSYSIEPQSGELMMSLSVRSAGLEAGDLIGTFEEFVRRAELWTDSLRAGRESVPELTAGDQGRTGLKQFSVGNKPMTRV